MATSSIPPFLPLSTLALSLMACAPPERGVQRDPWGGIDIDDDSGEEAGDTGPGPDDDSGDDGAGGETGDPGDGGDDGGADDAGGSNSDDGGADDGGPPPEDEPPASPYVGGWDIGTCQDDIVPTGTGVGQVAPDFLLFDQFGDQVRLHDFCHKAVYIIAGAFW